MTMAITTSTGQRPIEYTVRAVSPAPRALPTASTNGPLITSPAAATASSTSATAARSSSSTCSFHQARVSWTP